MNPADKMLVSSRSSPPFTHCVVLHYMLQLLYSSTISGALEPMQRAISSAEISALC